MKPLQLFYNTTLAPNWNNWGKP